MRFQKPRWLKNASTWMPKLRMPWPGPSYRHELQDRTGHGDTTTLAHTVAVAAEKVSNQTGHAGFLGHHEDLIFEINMSSWVSWCWLMLLWCGSFLWVDVVFLEAIYCLFFTVWVWKYGNIYLKVDVRTLHHFHMDEMNTYCCSASKTFLRYTLPTFSLLEISCHVKLPHDAPQNLDFLKNH